MAPRSPPPPATPASRHSGWRAALTPAPATARPATPVSVSNDGERTLWLSHLPQRELDEVARMLARGPVDGDFILALQGRLAHTALASPMVDGLVGDSLPALLPAGVSATERAAWSQVLASLLTCSRAGWEVACLPLRGALSAEVASTSYALQVIRDALYRPFDLPSARWQALLSAQRARGVSDCRAIALECRPATGGVAGDEAWLRARLRAVAPMLTRDLLQHGVTRALRRAAGDAGLLDPRHALSALFERLDTDNRPALCDATRMQVLCGLAALECPGRNGQGSRLWPTLGSPGARLADELVDVACRTGLVRQATPRAALPLTALALSGLQTALPLWLGW